MLLLCFVALVSGIFSNAGRGTPWWKPKFKLPKVDEPTKVDTEPASSYCQSFKTMRCNKPCPSGWKEKSRQYAHRLDWLCRNGHRKICQGSTCDGKPAALDYGLNPASSNSRKSRFNNFGSAIKPAGCRFDGADMLGNKCAKPKDIKLLMWSKTNRFRANDKKNKWGAEVIDIGEPWKFPTKLNTKHDPKKNRWIFLLHGFTSIGIYHDLYTDMWMKLVKEYDAIQGKNGIQYNVIFVDWSAYATMKIDENGYDAGARNTQVAGQLLAKWITAAMNKYKWPDAHGVHLVGQSLGAHFASRVGRELYRSKKCTKGTSPWKMRNVEKCTIGRITGLDSAGPNFVHGSELHPVALSKTAAMFVDVIHTNGGDATFITNNLENAINAPVVASLMLGALGTVDPCGDVDFYPNGGRAQPGTLNGLVPALSHAVNLDFFAASVRDGAKTFKAYPCKGKCLTIMDVKYKRKKPRFMGMWTNRLARGNYYLETNMMWPHHTNSWIGRKPNIQDYATMMNPLHWPGGEPPEIKLPGLPPLHIPTKPGDIKKELDNLGEKIKKGVEDVLDKGKKHLEDAGKKILDFLG